MQRPEGERSIPPDVTDDAFLGGALTILQPKSAYRAGIDAVLLAAATPPVSADARVLDAGAGVGVVGLCVAARVPEARVTLVEVEPTLVSLARENIARNALTSRVDAIAADITAPERTAASLGLSTGAFAHIVTNPPFYVEGQGRPSKNRVKAIAHAMPSGALERWIRALARLGASGSSLTLIHRAAALPELLHLLQGRFGALSLRSVHPRPGTPAVRILIQGWKGSRAPLTILPELILHEDGNGFRPEIADILRRGAGLSLSAAPRRSATLDPPD